MSLQLNWQMVMEGQLNRSRYVERYAGVPHLHPENIAEHSYYVAIYSFLLCHELYFVDSEYDPIDLGVVLKRALLHDIEECVTGDVLRSVKHDNPAIKKAFHDTGYKLLDGLVREILGPGSEGSSLPAIIIDTWASAKDNSIEGHIVSLADLLAVVGYASGESTLGNRYARRIQREITDNIREWVHQRAGLRTSDERVDTLCKIANDVIHTIH